MLPISQLESACARYLQLLDLLASPDIYQDRERYLALLKEKNRLAPIVEKYKEYCKAEEEIKEAEAYLSEGSDPDIKLLYEEELPSLKKSYEDLVLALRTLLLPHDPDDERNVVIEIRAGAGGEEAALFVAVLYRMYNMYAARAGYTCIPVSVNETELGGFREVIFSVEGKDAYSHFKYESGVHRVQRVPVTESQGRIQTSTATVAVLPEAEEVEVHIDPSEIRMESCKSSGAGGQHINKTESAVRLTHLPTGIVVECQQERSQFKNRDLAMRLLASKLYEMQKKERDAHIASARRLQIGTGDRSERIRTYNYPQGRLTDHRIGYTSYQLEDFLNGNIGQLLDALGAADTAEKLKESSEA